MTNFSNILKRRRPYFGNGVDYEYGLKPVQDQSIIYPTFKMGLDMSDAPENLDLDRAVYALDMEVSRNNRLIRAPGVLQLSDEVGHSLRWLFEQGSLDYVVELLAVDPPYFGYYDAGGWNWVNAGIADTGSFGWNVLNYLGDILFSNGVDATYTRSQGSAVATDISADIIARTFVEQFGRIFAGAVVDTGDLEVLRVKWNDTSGAIDGWAGTGAGSEFLLPPAGAADQIMAMRPLGFDLIAVLLRNSLWAGYPTGRDTRPADFRFRIGGVGCVSERTAKVTPGGCTFLSGEGVINYDVNQAEIISGQINSDLLPLDFTRLNEYSAAYIQERRRYILSTPVCTYVYEFPIKELALPGRWFKRSLIADCVVAFTNQAAVVTWADLIGTWAQQSLAWSNIGAPSWGADPRAHFGKGTLFGRDDDSTLDNFGEAFTPVWRTPQSLRDKVTDQVTTVGWEIIYQADDVSSVTLKTPDDEGDFNNEYTQELPATNGKVKKYMIWNQQTGQGAQAQIEIVSGSPQIARLRQIVQLSGPAVDALQGSGA